MTLTGCGRMPPFARSAKAALPGCCHLDWGMAILSIWSAAGRVQLPESSVRLVMTRADVVTGWSRNASIAGSSEVCRWHLRWFGADC